MLKAYSVRELKSESDEEDEDELSESEKGFVRGDLLERFGTRGGGSGIVVQSLDFSQETCFFRRLSYKG